MLKMCTKYNVKLEYLSGSNHSKLAISHTNKDALETFAFSLDKKWLGLSCAKLRRCKG
jgi:hypothetical protein